MSKVAFIGLGVMGYPMAGHLSTAGHDVTVFNRTEARVERWMEEFSGQRAATPADAAVGAEFVFTCVGNDDDLREVVSGKDGAFAVMAANTVFVDHTTTSAVVARELGAVAATRDIDFIDAPVSGGEAGANNGVLTVMCGGSDQAFARARPLIDSYARACCLMGPIGAGQLTKMVNQICIVGVIQGLAEGLNFGQKAGLDMNLVLDVIGKGAAQSWQMDNRGKTMCAGQYDFGFAVDWMRKDLGIVFDEAERLGARVPVAKLVDSYYERVVSMKGNRWDSSSLMAVMRGD